MVRHNDESQAGNVSRSFPKHVKPLGKLKSFRGNYQGHVKSGQSATSKLHAVSRPVLRKYLSSDSFNLAAAKPSREP